MCKDLGLATQRCAIGSQLAGCDDAQFAELAAACTVFAKVTPQQKLQIVSTLQVRPPTLRSNAGNTCLMALGLLLRCCGQNLPGC